MVLSKTSQFVFLSPGASIQFTALALFLNLAKVKDLTMLVTQLTHLTPAMPLYVKRVNLSVGVLKGIIPYIIFMPKVFKCC